MGTDIMLVLAEAAEAVDNIPNPQATLPEALTLVWQGMLGIFIVAAIIIACASLFGVLTSKKKRRSEK